MIFGSTSDFSLIRRMNRELLQSVVEQEILYYKIDLENTPVNIYGESVERNYISPVKINCLVTRGDQVITVQDFGPDMSRDVSFAFLREDLVDIQAVPEVGDIVFWQEDYYEVDTVRENQLFLGRDEKYNLTEYGQRFGASVSVVLDTHITRRDRVGLDKLR